MKRKVFGEEPVLKKRKRKGPKGANPLSCKKKKKMSALNSQSAEQTGKRKRKRKKGKGEGGGVVRNDAITV